MRSRFLSCSLLALLTMCLCTLAAQPSAQAANANFLTAPFFDKTTGKPVDEAKRTKRKRAVQRKRRSGTQRTRVAAPGVRSAFGASRTRARSANTARPKVRASVQRARAVRAAKPARKSRTAQVNGGRVGLISGGIGGTYIRIASDLASVLNNGNELRILPIVGQGSVQNITDILYLKGVDVGIVQSDVLAYIKARRLHRNIAGRIHYITKLYNEEFHLVGGREITDIRDLEGKAVNFGVAGSGTFMTATTVFEKLGISVKPVSHDQALAIEKIRTGEIAATVFVAGKPASAVAELKGSYGLQLISVDYDPSLQEAYLPAQFSAEDYPELVPDGTTINSIAVGAVMAVYNWADDTDRHQRVERFIESFFSSIEKFHHEPRHAKWREVSLAATLPGWTRYATAARWLKDNPTPGRDKLKLTFSAFMNANAVAISPDDKAAREALFQQFLKWQRKQRSTQ